MLLPHALNLLHAAFDFVPDLVVALAVFDILPEVDALKIVVRVIHLR